MSVEWAALRDDPAIIRLTELSDRVCELAGVAGLDRSAHPVIGDPGWVTRLRSRVASKATVAVIGQVSSGKSSFVNSLLGRKLLPSSDRPTDGVISVLQRTGLGEPERAERVFPDGRTEPFDSLKEAADFLARQHTSTQSQLRLREVQFYLDDPVLRDIRLINTPGLGDRLSVYEDVTLQYLHEDESDLIVWMFFPDSAANRHEVSMFSHELARRRNAVVGVVTRSLEDHGDDPSFDPRTDAGLAQVAEHLRTHLGSYLSDVVFYDSHTARRLVAQLRADPGLADDPDFVFQLERCGYVAMQRALHEAAGDDRQRARSALRRLADTSRELRRAAAACEQVFRARAKVGDNLRAAFDRTENEVLLPMRRGVDAEITQMADQFADELVTIFSTAATDIISERFTLGSALMDAATGMVKKFAGVRGDEALGSRLSHDIQTEVQRKLEASQFQQRLFNNANRIIGRSMNDLAARLRVELAATPGGQAQPGSVPVEVRRVGGAGAILADELVGRVLSALAEVAMKSAAKGTAVAGGAAVAGAGRAAAGAASRSVMGKALTVYSVVLVPLDIRKLYADFNQGRVKMAQAITSTFEAERPLHAKRIRETLLPVVDEAFERLRTAARTAMTPTGDETTELLRLIEASASAKASLDQLQDTFTSMASGGASRQ